MSHSLNRSSESEFCAKDPLQPSGHLTFRLERVGEMARAGVNAVEQHIGDTQVFVRELPWLIVAGVSSSWNHASKCLDFFVRCNGDTNDDRWSCLASVKLFVKARSADREDNVCTTSQHFSAQRRDAGFPQLMELDVLMNPENGWYDEQSDSVLLEAEIRAEPPRGVTKLPTPDLLVINGEHVSVNKELLAAHSAYFKTLFFGGRFAESKTGQFRLQVDEPPASTRHFERLMAVLYPSSCPEYRPLDEDCVEGVLHLANEYQIGSVEGLCLQFLVEQCAKSPLFKFRLAAKYGYPVLKEHILRNLDRSDFDKEHFEANVRECLRMGGGEDGNAFQELVHKVREWYPQKRGNLPPFNQ